MMAHIREEELMAHVDGELPGLDDGRVASALARDEALRAEAEAQRRLKERLARRYDAIIEEPVPERLRAMLEPKVVPFPAPARHPLRLGWPRAAAIAASLALAIVAVSLFPERASQSEPRLAGELSAALDAQLASTQAGGAATRVGISFAARDGRICRTYESGSVAGLACRGADGWRSVVSAQAAGQGGGEYRQAGSGPALVMETAEKIMAGAPFDAKAEREARDRGWTVR